MNSHLQNVLIELKKSGALGLPRPSVVEAAKNLASWHGKKIDGNVWVLTKNNLNSYTNVC